MRCSNPVTILASLLLSPLAFGQAQAPADAAASELPDDKSEQVKNDPLVKWLREGGEEQLKIQGASNLPIWKVEAFGKPCVDDPSAPKTEGAKKCNPKPPDPKPFTPCGVTSSCGPGIGRESGVISKERAELLEPLLRSNQPIEELIGEKGVAAMESKTSNQ